MLFIKVKHGLLEEENFYLTSSASDFLGEGTWSRTDTDFKLFSGEIKRKLPYKDGFVIDVKKKTSDINIDTEYTMFIENDNAKFGLKEIKGDETAQYWRIIYHNGFIQTYSSQDGEIWLNKGGCNIEFEGDLFQGFEVKGGKELVITNYNIYNSPYLKLQNFPLNTVAQIYNSDNTIVKERVFDDKYECDIFLDKKINGYIKIFSDSTLNTLLFTSSIRDFFQGDVFLFSNENIQLIYKNKVLDYEVTNIESYKECLIVKNSSDIVANDIHIEVINNSEIIEISFDDTNYSKVICLDELNPQQEIKLYIKIVKDNNFQNFKTQQFDINIY